MDTVKLSSKGQFVLPKSIRDFHHWGPGTELVVVERGSEVVITAARPFATTRLESPETPSVYSGKTLSIEDMDRAIEAEAGKRR